jgi:hypothetical protein
MQQFNTAYSCDERLLDFVKGRTAKWIKNYLCEKMISFSLKRID